jgi:hypothetical protein
MLVLVQCVPRILCNRIEPERAPLDAGQRARAWPPAEGTRPMALKTAARGNLVSISRVVFCSSRSSLTPFEYVVTISAQCLT